MAMIANSITCIRFLLIPYIVQSMTHDCWPQAFVLFALAAVTDFLDGFCARFFNNETALGRILDPLADKALVLSALYALSGSYNSTAIPAGFFLFLLLKDFVLIAGGFWLFLARGTTLAPSAVSKNTTALEMVVILYVSLSRAGYVACPAYFLDLALSMIVMLSLYVLVDYIVKGIVCLTEA